MGRPLFVLHASSTLKERSNVRRVLRSLSKLAASHAALQLGINTEPDIPIENALAELPCFKLHFLGLRSTGTSLRKPEVHRIDVSWPATPGSIFAFVSTRIAKLKSEHAPEMVQLM